MTKRVVVVPFVLPKLRERYLYNAYAKWAGRPLKTSNGYQWPCWVCGVDGVLWQDIKALPVGIVRFRSLMHEACWEALTLEERNQRYFEDDLFIIRRMERREQRIARLRKKGKPTHGIW